MKKSRILNVLMLILLIGTGVGKLFASEYYWVGNSGNWSDLTHWASSSGGAGSGYGVVPTSLDNVHFDANSFNSSFQTITIDQTIVSCLNMDWTGVANTPTLTFSSSGNILNISGSLTLVSTMALTDCGPINFIATTAGQTVTCAGNFLNNTLTFDGAGGSWTLQDALTTSANIIFNTGTLNSNGQTVNASQFISTSGNTRTLNMGSSVFNLSWISVYFWQVSATGMTLNAGTSTINATNTQSGWTPYFVGGGLTYYDMNFTGTNLGSGGGIIQDGGNTFNDVTFAANGAIYGNNIFHNVTFSNNGTIGGTETYNNLTFSPGFTYTLGNGQTQTINGTFSATGTCTAGITIQSDANAATTISMATGPVVLDYVTLTYITATGGASFTANDATDGGNNTGWTINVLPSQDLYWIGGTGNWSDGSHWSTTSGGSAFNCTPGSGDNVFFDVNSFTGAGQTVTLDAATANCNNMTWTGVTNVPTLTGNSSTLNIYGSLTLAASGTAMNVTFSGPVNFNATTTGQTITSGGNSFGGNIAFNGTGGWTLQDAFTTTQNINLNAGTLNSNNQTVSGSQFISTTTNTRALNMGSSVFNLSWISVYFWQVSATGMTLNAGTSTINATNTQSGWTPYFVGGGLTYYNLNWTGTNLGSGGGVLEDGGNTFNDVSFAANGSIYGNNTYHNVTFSNNGTIDGTNTYNDLTFSPGFTYTLTNGQTQTINGTFSATGTCTAGITIQSDASAATTISMATGPVVLDYVTLTYITATGGASFTANDAIDGGNNTGWTINTNAARNLYWIGGTGNWSDGSHWSLTSGGSALGCSPGSTDNVFFDANSFTGAGQTVTLDAATANCNNMTWTGVTNVPTLTGNSSTLNIYGSLTLAASGTAMNVTFSGPVNFNATTTGQTITSGGNSFGGNIAFNGTGGWTLQDAFTTTQNINLNAGTLNSNNQTVSGSQFISTTTNTRTLNMGSSVFNLSWISVYFWQVSATGMTLNAGTSTINATNTQSGWTPYFVGGGLTYYNLNWPGTNLGSGGGIIQDGGNTFNDVTFASNGAIYGNNTFHNVTFFNNGTIGGTETYNDLTFSPAYTYILNSGATQTVNGTLNISGTGGFPVRIEASTSGTPATISMPAVDTVCADYIRISDNTATGGAVFIAGTNSQDLGGNTGWNFAGASTAPGSLNASSNPICSGGSGTTLTQSGGSLGALAYWQWYSDAGYTTKVGGPVYSANASISVTPGTTTTYYLQAEWPSCISPLPGPSGGITITVNPVLTPAVNISITSGSQTMCTGASATFTSVPTNGGSAPDYNFEVNGISVQDGASDSYSSTALNNNDAVTCVLTSNAMCVSPATANSNSITMTVNTVLTPAVSISITSGSQTTCTGSGVTFTAVPTNGGSAPDYNFEVNGISVQDGASATYNSSALNNNDAVTCILTSNSSCASPTTANSNSITMTVNTVLTPAISISITSGSQTICTGSGVTFTAVPTNGGGAPDYNFEVNGISVQDGASSTYSSTTLNNNDAITCILTSSATCASPATANSNSITMTVNFCGPNTWLGNTSVWSTTTNWSAGVVPSCIDNGDSIPVTANNPVISSPAFAGNLIIDDGVTLTVNALLSVCGNLTGGSRTNATVQGSSTLTLIGSSLQTISGYLGFQNQLTLDNTSGGGTQAQLATGAVLDIYDAVALQNNNTFNTSLGTLTLKSTSVTQAGIIDNFSAGNSGTVTGNITAERYYGSAPASNDFNQHMLGSPVTGINLSALGSNSAGSAYFQAAIGGVHNCNEILAQLGTPYGNVFSYDESHASSCTMDGWKVGASSTAISSGTGYSVVLGSGSGTLHITGAPNLNSSYSVATINSGYPNTTSDQGRVYTSGINLLSNPYPASLDPSLLISDNPNYSAAVYVWNESTGSYYQPAIIAPFQAFKVILGAPGVATSGNYVINGTSRTTAQGSFQRVQNPVELSMTVTNNSTGLTDETTVGFNPNSTAQFNAAYDLIKMPGALTRHTLYTLNSGDWMWLNVLKSISETSTVLVGFEPGVSGTYTANFTGLSSFDPTSYITLEDTKLHIFHDVRSGDYTFTSDATNDSWNRFVLHFTPPASFSATSATCSEQGMINIVQPGTAIWNYTIADNNNVTLSAGTLNATSPVTATVAAGVYTITLVDNNGYTVVKTMEVKGATPVIASFISSASSVGVNQEVTLSSTSTNATIYNWNFGDGTTENGAAVSHAYATEGVYVVTLNTTSTSGCTSSASSPITVTRSVTGVTNLSNTGNILIWSNENIVNIDFTQLKDVQANIEVYNIIGQKIVEDKYVASAVYRKEIPNIEEGYILVSVKNGDSIITKKVFISNAR